MIAPQELRIGNLIMDEDGEVCAITGFDAERSFHHKGEDKTYQGVVSLNYGDWRGSIGRWLEKCKPIPLTPIWLLKFGFEKKKWDNIPGVGTFYFYEHRLLNHRITEQFTMPIVGVEIKSVHHLQNITFAITGEELTIKEQK